MKCEDTTPMGDVRDKGILLGTIELPWSGRETTKDDIIASLMSGVWPGGERRNTLDIVKPGESVCLVLSDQTRKTAADAVLPALLGKLAEKGCRTRDFFIIFATGIHRSPTPAETALILGPEVAREFEGRIFQHDPDSAVNLVKVGATRRGHRVRVNRRAVEADRLIPIGTATYHYHAGFGGGRKSLVPGLAARETIAHNHSLTIDPTADRIHPNVDVGVLDGNPVAEEMLEAARLCEPDFIVNTVLTPQGKFVGVFAGELDAAHRAACRLVAQTCRVNIEEQADVVIASAGTAPNWIQSHKALFNAHRAMKPGGRIVLFAPCPEGIGDERFRHWAKKAETSEIYRELRRSPEVLGQTALSTKTRGAAAILVTAMSQADIADLGIRAAPDVRSAIDMAFRETGRKSGSKPTCYLMPDARGAVPFISR